MSNQLSPKMKALLDMKEGRLTAESKNLAQSSRAITIKSGDASPKEKQLSESSQGKEREVEDFHFAPITTSQSNNSGDKPPVSDDLIRGLMEGRIRQGQVNTRNNSTQAIPKVEKNNVLQAANALMEGMENTKPSVTVLNEVATSSKQILTEVVMNLRKGGILKEEIIKIVLEEALTETIMVPLMEKHFKRLLKEFLQERKKS